MNQDREMTLPYAIYLASHYSKWGVDLDDRIIQTLLDEINRLHKKYPEEECERLC